MICPSCTSGGELNSLGRYEEAGKSHEECKYPTSCTCQHTTGSGWIQTADIKATS